MLNLINKNAYITGGGSGIGKAMCLLFAVRGATVHIIDKEVGAATAVANEIEQLGYNSIAHAVDITDQQQICNIFKENDRPDILVNNAGVAHVGNLELTNEADLDRIYRVNVKGTYNCLFAAIPYMKELGGVILNMASIAAHVGIQDRFAYSMSKGAIYSMTMSVARDYINFGIRCNSISPARVHTPFVDGFIANNYPGKEAEVFKKLSQSQPIGRMAAPEEVAQMALYLCSDEAGFITGCDYPIDGGFIKLNN